MKVTVQQNDPDSRRRIQAWLDSLTAVQQEELGRVITGGIYSVAADWVEENGGRRHWTILLRPVKGPSAGGPGEEQ